MLSYNKNSTKRTKQLNYSQKLEVIEYKNDRHTMKQTRLPFLRIRNWEFSVRSLKRWLLEEETIAGNSKAGINASHASSIPITESKLIQWMNGIGEKGNFPMTFDVIKEKAERIF